MREITICEIDEVSGGTSTTGAAIALGGTIAAIAAIGIGVIGAPLVVAIGGVVAMGATAAAGLGYAYDKYESMRESGGGIGIGGGAGGGGYGVTGALGASGGMGMDNFAQRPYDVMAY